MTSSPTGAPTVLVGVGAGIAAYKTVQVVRSLRVLGYDVFALPTVNSLEFVGVQTWQELSENPVHATVFHGRDRPGHIELARRADLVIVAPCTADLAARLAAGLADDLLTTTILATSAPKLLVPAMHSGMWQNPATQANFATLKERGFRILPPAAGALSSGDTGVGRMVEPDQIVATAKSLLFREEARWQAGEPTGALAGKRVVVSAGGTVEPVDPVRYLSNYSSGRQGVALAEAAANMGADVTLLAAKCEVPLPEDHRIEVVSTPSALDMSAEVASRLPATDVLVMTAAVADYRPATVAEKKLKKDNWGQTPSIPLVRNPDILREAAGSPHRPPLVIGFAAETGSDADVLAHGRAKAKAKGADLLAINRVGGGQGFGDVPNQLWVVDGNGELVSRLAGTKEALAEELLTLAAQF